MIRKFINLNKVALKTGFFWTSFIFTLIILVIFSISYFNGNLPEKDLFILVLLGASIGSPTCITLFAFLRWVWDYSIFKRNFNSLPFNQIDTIGFKKKEKISKWNFSIEYFTGEINGFIVDSDIDTQNESKHVRFKFYVKPMQFEKQEYKQIQKKLSENNGCLYFDTVIKRFHFKNHRLRSISDLESELIKFSNLIKHEKIEPSEFANR